MTKKRRTIEHTNNLKSMLEQLNCKHVHIEKISYHAEEMMCAVLVCNIQSNFHIYR